jgi:DnaJ-class molecular chaperone
MMLSKTGIRYTIEGQQICTECRGAGELTEGDTFRVCPKCLGTGGPFVITDLLHALHDLGLIEEVKAQDIRTGGS